MTLHIPDLILIAAVVAAAGGAAYLFLLRRLRLLLNERHLKIAEELGALNDAIQALETRLAEHHPVASSNESSQVAIRVASEQSGDSSVEELESTVPEINAAIAAAAIAALGPNVQVKSIKPAGQPATSPWTQQGRVLVQGSHNLRVRR